MAKAGYNPVLGPTIAGFIGGLPFIVLAAVLLIKKGTRLSNAKTPAAANSIVAAE